MEDVCLNIKLHIECFMEDVWLNIKLHVECFMEDVWLNVWLNKLVNEYIQGEMSRSNNFLLINNNILHLIYS